MAAGGSIDHQTAKQRPSASVLGREMKTSIKNLISADGLGQKLAFSVIKAIIDLENDLLDKLHPSLVEENSFWLKLEKLEFFSKLRRIRTIFLYPPTNLTWEVLSNFYNFLIISIKLLLIFQGFHPLLLVIIYFLTLNFIELLRTKSQKKMKKKKKMAIKKH